MANIHRPARYAKGISEAYVMELGTWNILAHDNKFTDGNISISENAGEISGGLNNDLLLNIPDTRRLTGTFNAADYSMDVRAMQLGTKVQYNATILARENITASSTTLTLTGTPVRGYFQSLDDKFFPCYVGEDSQNYGVDPTTKEVQDFTAEVGKTYCVMYYTKMASAEFMPIPTSGAPLTAMLVVKTPLYGENGASSRNSTLVAMHYYFVKAQFIGGDPGYNGSQTDASTTPWSFMAIADDTNMEEMCSDCEGTKTVYGYEVIVPCGPDAKLSAVTNLVVVGGVLPLTVGESKQTPVFYVMENGELVTPQYSDLVFVSATPATATVSETGMITAVAEGTTNITVTSKLKPTLKEASISVTVTA